MAKPDKAALKAEGKALGDLLVIAKKRALNVAILEKDGAFVVEGSPKGNPDMMRRAAKKSGGGPKGVCGIMRLENKIAFIKTEDEPPGNYPKRIRQYFMSRGAPIKKLILELPGGKTLADGEEEEDGAPVQAPQAPGATDDGNGTGPAPSSDGGGGDGLKPDGKTGPDTLGPVLHKAYGVLKSELDEKREQAEESLKKALAQAELGFKRAMDSKEYETAKAMLSQIKKSLAKIQPKSMFDRLVDSVKENVGEFVDELSDAIDEKVEDLKELGEEVLEKAEDVLQAVGDKVGILSEHDKAQKEKLKNFDLPEDQQLSLVQLARDNPKSFEAALKVLAKMEGDHADLVPTAAGVEAAKKAVDDAKTEKAALEAEQKAIARQYHAAKALADQAVTDAKASDTQYKQAVAAMTEFKKNLPKDMSKLSKDKQLELVNQMNALINAEADLKAKRAADIEKVKTTKAAQDKEEQDWRDKGTEIEAAKGKIGAEEEKVKATKAKKDLMDSLTTGVLSPDGKNPMSDADIAKVLGAFEADPALGQKALGLLEKSGDRANLADGIERITKGMGNGFKDKDGNAYGDEAAQKQYAKDALEMGAAMGGDYFKNMEKFVEGGGLNKPNPVPLASGSSWKKLEQDRAKYVADSMLDSKGKIDTKSPKAQEALAMMNFHPGTMENKTPGMNMHFETMSAAMDDPKHKQKLQDVLDGIKSRPTSATGRKLVARNIGKSPGDVTKEDVKSSVMSAMFTPLDQGPVGSCFATGPARRVVEEDPAKAMGHITEIAMKGRFTTAQGDKIKAISTNKLPEDDNQLMRSFEYTVATAGATMANSIERSNLNYYLFNDPDGMKKIKTLLPDPAKWPEVRGKIQTALADGLSFRYDATSEIGDSNDGSSTQGNFQIIDKSTNKAILTKDAFIKTITRIALAATGEDKSSETGVKIVDLCKSDSFIDAVCEGDYKPWELPGGGFSTGPSKVLHGGDPQQKEISATNYKLLPNGDYELDANKNRIPIDAPGERTKKVVAGLIGKFATAGPDSEMIDLSTSGIHAFGGLPNHPSLDKLKEGGDPAAAIEKYILKPGEEMAKTDLAVEKTGLLFDQQLDAMEGWDLFSGGAALLADARTKRPTTAMKPSELKAHVDAATKPLRDYMARERAKVWKKEQEDAGEVVSNGALAAKVEEWKKDIASWSDDDFSNNIIDNLEPPQFVIADTNWGDKDGHTYFVVIPDPITGEAKMFKKTEPSGTLEALGDDWINTEWQVAE